MIFHEINSAYYACVAAILSEAQQGTLTGAKMNGIIRKKGFADSALVIPQKLKDGSWPLLDGRMETPLEHKPTLPLSLLQKRWLKALLLDPRIRLFDVSDEGLQDVEPLFRPEMFVWYDRYTGGDPYMDEGYISRFKLLLRAIREQKAVAVRYISGRGKERVWMIRPTKMEYSMNDDKFRLVLRGKSGQPHYMNLGRILACTFLEEKDVPPLEFAEPGGDTIELILTDARNALERFMLQFAYLQKETEQTEEDKYRVILHHRPEDEAELLIRLLSFGPAVRVVKPEGMANAIRDRVQRQQKMLFSE